MSKESVSILLVEDSLAEARLLHEVLKGTALQQFNLVHVKRLREALEQLQANHFDVVLLDLTLPDSQGLTSVDSLSSHAPNLPIVVLTNTNDDELAIEAVRQGAQDYLVKRQVTGDILVRSCRYAIERKQVSEALREANEALEIRVQERTAELAQANALLKQEVQQRQRAQERLELAQRAGRIGSFEWDLQSNQVTWTAELEALYGCASGSFANQYSAWAKTLYPDDRVRVEQEFRHAVRAGTEVNIEFRIVCSTGEIRWIAAQSSVFFDATGGAGRMLGVHIDITEKKQLEAQFLQAQRLESLGTLASGIAHDLNNILTPILTITQLLALKLPSLSDKNRQLLATLETSAKRGADLVKQILSFARGVEGKRATVQIGTLLSEIKKIIQQTFPRSIEIALDLPSDVWLVSVDITQLHQVLVNLCVNARDAMPWGGVLSISTENLWLNEQAARLYLDAKVGPYVVITVADTGVGIPSSILHRIFDPFFTTKAIGKGTGLGLSAVLGIIKSHGGFVDVKSDVGKGSQFKVGLPALQGGTTEPKADLELLSGHEELILVVDDEVAICEMLKTTLETYSYKVLTASNGTEALALYTQHQNEVRGVLIDIMMPAMDGPTTIPLLRTLNPQLQVIAMSGLPSIEAVEQAENTGSQGFLAKPFTTRELLQALHVIQH